jgi:acetolactate synthase-1/2/3 large subunit
MKAAELFVACLENEGIDAIFGIPGEENIDVMDALLASDVRFVLTRHEQAAAFMADVYGRLTGRAGVCLATLGPGACNLVTGVADANMDRAPVVAIAGQADTLRMHKESHQYMDLVAMFEPISKYSTQIRMPEIIPEVVRKAFKVAQAEKPGVSFIELPENVAEADVEGKAPLTVQQAALPHPAPEKVAQAAALLSAARYPMVMAGNGVLRGEASQALVAFAERLNVPVATTFMAKGAIPFSHPLSLGTVGLQSRDHVSCGFDRADVIVCVGYDMVEYHPRLWHPDQVIVAELQAHRDDDGFPVKPQKIVWELRQALAATDIVISDVGAHKMWVARMYEAEAPNTCIISNGFASMGIGVPGAIAAKLVHPDRKVVTVTGDAGFMMNSQELETALRLQTPIVVLIWRDDKYGLIEWHQNRKFGRPSHIAFDNPDFVRFAESFGAKGYRVESTAELAPTLRQALADDTVVVIDCPVDYSENMKLTEKLGQLSCRI